MILSKDLPPPVISRDVPLCDPSVVAISLHFLSRLARCGIIYHPLTTFALRKLRHNTVPARLQQNSRNDKGLTNS
jgi:hypothetical protein